MQVKEEIRVVFRHNNEILHGKLAFYDPDGGGIWWGKCPSYDIDGDDGVLYKHVPEDDVEPEERSID